MNHIAVIIPIVNLLLSLVLIALQLHLLFLVKANGRILRQRTLSDQDRAALRAKTAEMQESREGLSQVIEANQSAKEKP